MRTLAVVLILIAAFGCESHHYPSSGYKPIFDYNYSNPYIYRGGGSVYYEPSRPYTFYDKPTFYEPEYYQKRHRGLRVQPYADDPLGGLGLYYPNVRTREIRTGYGMPYQPGTRTRDLKTILGTEDEPLGRIGSRYRP